MGRRPRKEQERGGRSNEDRGPRQRQAQAPCDLKLPCGHSVRSKGFSLDLPLLKPITHSTAENDADDTFQEACFNISEMDSVASYDCSGRGGSRGSLSMTVRVWALKPNEVSHHQDHGMCVHGLEGNLRQQWRTSVIHRNPKV